MSTLRTFADFLAKAPPGTQEDVDQLFTTEGHPGRGGLRKVLRTPDVALECSSDQCGGSRTFGLSEGKTAIVESSPVNVFMVYVCRNCSGSTKTYALQVRSAGQGHYHGQVLKIGEQPPFGPSTPARVNTLIGPDRDLFLKGRRAEIQGLGIGAFGYYRRVVEGNKDRLLDAIIKVGKRSGLSPDSIAKLEAAKRETQFRKAVENIKDAIPDDIRVKGLNPLTLLYGPLSEGIHDKTDEECLALATSVREVLLAMAERIGEALKEQRALDDAIKRLQSPQGGS